MNSDVRDILNDANKFQVKFLKKMPLSDEDFNELANDLIMLGRKYKNIEFSLAITEAVEYIEKVDRLYKKCNY